MKLSRTTLFALAAAAALSLVAATPGLVAAQDCLSNQQIQTAIQGGQIKSWPKIKKLAGITADSQEVSDVRVCLIGGMPYYTVNVVSPYGEAKKIVLNAVDGSQ